MLCVYMRPWTLDKEAACIDVPFLGDMREVLRRETSSDGHEPLHADAVAAFRSTAEAGQRRRLRQWTSPPLHLTPPLLSYVLSWMRYIDGNVVSEASRQYISNLMSATAARLVEKPEDIESESEEDDMDQPKGHAGNMSLVRKTLQGIASHDTE